MARYTLSPEEEKFLNDNEKELNFFTEPEEGLSPQAREENSLYDLIWQKVLPRLFQEHANNNGTQPPWSFFRSLEKEWNLKAPHPHAFQALAELPTAAKFKPHGFIQRQHENIVAKILVGSVAWWFAPCRPSRSTKYLDFMQPPDDLIISLVKYDACFIKKYSVVCALQRLYSRFEESESGIEAFNFDFILGQSEHSLRREREREDRIKVETEEREARAEEAKRLELEMQQQREEEETAKRERQDVLYRKGGRAISKWFVGEVTEIIEEAKEEGFENLFQQWWRDAEQLKGQVTGITGDNMTYRVKKIISTLGNEAQLAEINR